MSIPEPESVPTEVSEQDWAEQQQPTAPEESDPASCALPDDTAAEVPEGAADEGDLIEQELDVVTDDEDDR